MPVYKLTYFDTRGFAEPSRLLFHLAGVDFEDVRLHHGSDTFTKVIKEKTPFQQVPVLNVDGFDIPQSAAITRYLARKFGYAGKTPEEEAWADAIVDQFRDFITSLGPFFSATRLGKSAEEFAKISEAILPDRDSYYRILNGILKKSKSGYLVGDGLTWADLVVADNLYTLEKNGFFKASEEPKLQALLEKVYGEEKLKNWIATRPDTQF